MEEEGRSQAWLARKLRVKPQSVGAWIRGEEACPLSRQAQIAIHLNVPRATYFDNKRFAIVERTS